MERARIENQIQVWIKLATLAGVVLGLGAPCYVSASDTKAAKASYKRSTKLDFEEKALDGEFVKPDARDVDGNQNVEFEDLLKPRTDFRRELKRSAGVVR